MFLLSIYAGRKCLGEIEMLYGNMVKIFIHMKLLFSLFEYIAYILGCTCSVLVDDVRIKHSKAAVPCRAACFTMLFVQWMRAELEYFCLAAYKGSQSVVAQET